MKKIITAVALLLAGYCFSYAQCDKKVILTSAKTEYLNLDSSLQRTVDEFSEIVFDKSAITIKPGDDPTITGAVNTYTCNFTTPYKEGRLELKTTFMHGNEAKQITITITGKNGKVILLAKVEGEDRIIRLELEKFEEKLG